VPENRLHDETRPRAAGLLVVLAGLLITGAGFGIFAAMAKRPEAGAAPGVLALVSVVVGLTVVEAGSWLNAAFYRSLEKGAARPWIEVGGGIVLVAGAVVVGNGAALWLTGAAPAPVAAMAAGLMLIEVALAAEHRLVLRMCGSPSFPLTLIVVAAGVLGAAALALVSVVNVRHYRRLDLTRSGVYSLDSQTARILKSVREPLRIISTLAQRPASTAEEKLANFIRAQASEILEEYAQQSRLVDYIPLDPYAAPEATARLAAELRLEILADSIVFATRARTRVVAFSDLLAQAPLRGGPPEFRGEGVLTSALQSLLEGKTTKVCFVTGHGEKEIDEFDREGISAVAEMLRGDNCDVAKCTLSGVPDDCGVLVVAGPSRPLGTDGIEAIRAYAARKGAGLVLLLDPVSGDARSSGLEPWLKAQGIVVHTDETLIEPLPGGILSGGWSVTIETSDYGKGQGAASRPAHPIVRDMTQKVRTAFHFACPIDAAAPRAVEIVRTSPRACAKAGLEPADLGRVRIDRAVDKPGPFAIAVAQGATRGEAAGRLVVVGDSDFITNLFPEQGVTGNSTLFRNAVAWAAGKDYKIGIPPKPLQQADRLDMTAEQRAFARWATVFVPPFHILLVGLIVWWIRRR